MESFSRFPTPPEARKTRLYRWQDKLVAAYDAANAAQVILDNFEVLLQPNVRPVTGDVDYFNHDGEKVGTVNGQDCSAVWPAPCVVTDLS